MQSQPNSIPLQANLLTAIEEMAEKTRIPKEKLIQNALIEMLEDYHDAIAAEDALERIESGEDKLFTWDEVKAGLHELED